MKKPARRRLSRVFCMFRDGAELYVVREAGLEPAHPCGRQDLNLVRLPISPLTRVSITCQRIAHRPRAVAPTCKTGAPDQASARFYPIRAALSASTGEVHAPVLECRA